jgi:hypothetical protein
MDPETMDDVRREFFPWSPDSADVVIRTAAPAERRGLWSTLDSKVLPGYEPLVGRSLERQASNPHVPERVRGWHTEYFVALDGERPIAWIRGQMKDPATFYLQTGGVAHGNRRARWAKPAYLHVLAYLEQLGYERVNSWHEPNNNAILIFQLRLGFVIEGVVLDERFGPLVSMVKHLHTDQSDEYRQRFRLSAHDLQA